MKKKDLFQLIDEQIGWWSKEEEKDAELALRRLRAEIVLKW